MAFCLTPETTSFIGFGEVIQDSAIMGRNGLVPHSSIKAK
jgi:hypothetical protein